MADKTWKAVERRVARMFGAKRNPLSGSNSGHTQADVIHNKLFIEVKHRSRIPFYKVWEDTKHKAYQENKIPVLVIHQKGSKDYIAIIDASYLAELMKHG